MNRRHSAESDRYRAIPGWKRAFDLVGAAVGLLLLFPLWLVLAAAVRITIGKPVLFRQQRPGVNGRPFTIFKFRTMKNTEAGLIPDAERITRFGAFLRRTSLDEIPELWNVLCGDMSLIGPRPLLMQYLDRYSPEQRRRHEVLPGITGLAQVNGRNAISWEQRFALDVWYVDHRSFWLDINILSLTLKQLFSGKDIAHPGFATMPEFMGTPTQKLQSSGQIATGTRLLNCETSQCRELE